MVKRPISVKGILLGFCCKAISYEKRSRKKRIDIMFLTQLNRYRVTSPEAHFIGTASHCRALYYSHLVAI